MSDELSRYLQYAQLSWAAYTPLDDTFTGPIPVDQLTNPGIGFPTQLAGQFSARYTVLSHLEDTEVGLGFSATLFEKIEANPDGSHDKILSIRGTNGPGDLSWLI